MEEIPKQLANQLPAYFFVSIQSRRHSENSIFNTGAENKSLLATRGKRTFSK
jgi:hypothetical protein